MNQKQLLCLLLCASVAPIFHFAGNESTILIVILLGCELAIGFVQPIRIEKGVNRFYTGLYAVLLYLLTINYSALSSESWEYTPAVVSIVLLALSYFASENIGKLASVLFYGGILFLAIIIISGIKDIKYERISIKFEKMPWQLLPVVFMPLSGITYKNRWKYIIIEICLIIVAVIWVQGNSPFIGEARTIVFAGKNISGIGSLSKLDGVISILMTISWFCLLGYLQKEMKMIIPKKYHLAIELSIAIAIIFKINANWIFTDVILLICLLLSRFGKNALTR